jgi:hypothetical protein
VARSPERPPMNLGRVKNSENWHLRSAIPVAGSKGGGRRDCTALVDAAQFRLQAIRWIRRYFSGRKPTISPTRHCWSCSASTSTIVGAGRPADRGRDSRTLRAHRPGEVDSFGRLTYFLCRAERRFRAKGARSRARARISELGGIPLTGSSGDFRKLFVDDAQKWTKVMREANIKPE